MLERGYYKAEAKTPVPEDPGAELQVDGTMFGYRRAAFLSVANKTPEIAAFAVYLHDSLGLVLYGSDGTTRFLEGQGIACNNYASIGAPPMFSHGVVSLHPRVMGALIARKDKPEHMAQLVEIDAPCCEVFVGGFYDLDALIAKGELSFEDLCDKIDVGGPAQAVGGAKRLRIVIVDEADIPAVWKEMEASNGEVSEATRRHLCGKALATVAQHYLTAANFVSGGEYAGIIGEKVRDLPRPENGDQAPAAMFRSLRKSSSALALHRFEVMSGGPGYVNLADIDATRSLMHIMAQTYCAYFGSTPYICIICKHGNPCGIGVGFESPRAVLVRALFGDTDAAMGGECMTNFPIDAIVSEMLYCVPEGSREKVGRELWGMDVIAAPGYSPEALELLGKRAKRSLLANPALLHPEVASASEWMYRPIEGGFLRQKSYHFTLPPESLDVSPELAIDLIIAWAVAWRAKSNSVALARDGQLIALGAGQQDRRSCVLLLLERAKNARHDTAGAVFGSDGFFPFARRASEDKPLEAPELLIEAGCVGGVVPADGMRIEDVKALFAEHGLNVVFVDKSHRGFAWH